MTPDGLSWHLHMHFEQYIANRIGERTQGSFSDRIMKIAIAAIALSVMVMIMTTTIITGFKNQISEKVFDFWGHIHVTDGLSGDSFELIPLDADPALVDTIKKLTSVTYARPSDVDDYGAQVPIMTSKGGVTHVESYIQVPSIVADKSQFEGLLMKGVSTDFDVRRIQKFMKEGAFIDLKSDTPSRDVVVSQRTAQRMGYQIGQKVNVNFMLDEEPRKRQFEISGIYNTGLDEYDRRYALVDARVLQELLDWNTTQVSGLEIFVEDLDDVELINDFIYFELLPPRAYSETVRNKFGQIFHWLELTHINENVIIILMTLVAIINMITALIIFVLERTRMIGVLKSLGATNWSVRKIFIISATRIIVKGVIIGNILAIVLCLIQKHTGLVKLRESDYYLSQVPIEFNLWSILLINLGTILIVALFMLIPSMIISQITPIRTLQFK